MLLRRHSTVNRDLENQILISLITSDKVLRRCHKVLEPKLMGLEVSKTVVGWIKSYYRVYGEAPKRNIQAIYNQEAPNLKEELATQVADFLESLSDDFIDNPPNEAYMMDITLDYLKKSKLKTIATDIITSLDVGRRLEDAEGVLHTYDRETVEDGAWVNPFDDEEHLFQVFDEREEPLYEFPGELGRLFGPIRRDWLIGFMGPMKRGKTWWLNECAFHALSNRRRVVFISLEMKDTNITQRTLQRLTSKPMDDADIELHTFDCAHNQMNLCNIPDRTCRVANGQPGYRPCTFCYGRNDGNYAPTYSTFTEHVEGLDFPEARSALDRFARHFGRDNFRLKSYPPFSANLKIIQNDLDILVHQRFIPDVIIIDYADILAPEDGRKDFRHQVDETWKTLKRMAVERHCNIITATQGNRRTFRKSLIEEDDTSEDIRKLAHPDIFAALSQDREERQYQALRVNLLAHRWKGFDPTRNVRCLYNFDLGQPMLDSQTLIYTPPEEEHEQTQRGSDNRPHRLRS